MKFDARNAGLRPNQLRLHSEYISLHGRSTERLELLHLRDHWAAQPVCTAVCNVEGEVARHMHRRQIAAQRRVVIEDRRFPSAQLRMHSHDTHLS